MRKILTQREQYPLSPTLIRADLLREAVAQGMSARLPTDEVMKYFHSVITPDDLDPDFDADVRTNGVRQPIEISTDGTRAAITEGHHRTLSAHGAGHPDVPVQIYRVHPSSFSANRGGELGNSLRDLLHARPLEYGASREAGPSGFEVRPIDPFDVSDEADHGAGLFPRGGQDPLASLAWRRGGEVAMISTHPEYQRQGLATQLFNHVKQHLEPGLHHSPHQTEEGSAWARQAAAGDDHLVLYHGTGTKHLDAIKNQGLMPRGALTAGWPMLTTDFDQAARYTGGRPDAAVLEYHVPKSHVWSRGREPGSDPSLWPGVDHDVYDSKAQAYSLRRPLTNEFLHKVHEIGQGHTAALDPEFEDDDRTASLERVGAHQPHLMVPTNELTSYFVHTPPPSEYASSDRHPNLPEDIAQHGVQEPLTVATDGTWAHLEDGYHRAAEAQRQGIESLPVIIKGHDERTYPAHKRLNPVGESLQEYIENKYRISPKSEQYGTPEHLLRQKMHQQGLDSLRDYRRSKGIIAAETPWADGSPGIILYKY